MGSKSIIALGILVSLGFIYTCIEDKKEEVFKAVELISPQNENELAVEAPAKAIDEEEVLASIEEITQPSQNLTKTVVKEKSVVVSNVSSSDKKEEIAKPQGSLEALEVVETNEALQPQVVTLQKSDPAFGMMFEEEIKVVGMFEMASKEGALVDFIDKFCKESGCSNDIRFSEDIKHVEWEKELIALIQFMQENHIPHGSFFINTNLLSIEGDIEGKAQQKRLQTIIRHLEAKGLSIENKTIFKEEVHLVVQEQNRSTPPIPKIATNPISKELKENKKELMELPKSLIVAKPKTTELKERDVLVSDTLKQLPQEIDLQKLQKKIDKILRQSPIVFVANNNQISPESKKVLDEIATLIQNAKAKRVEIAAYTAKKSDPIFSKVISQKRADTIQRYLRHKGIVHLFAKGYGESGFLKSLDPKDPKNERIEIYLKKGE